MSLAHLNDSIGYEVPHVLGHLRSILKTTKDPNVRRDAQHALGHTKNTAAHNAKLTQKLMMIPSVKSVVKEVKRDKKIKPRGGSS